MQKADFKKAEKKALELLREYKVKKPCVDVVMLAEKKGIEVHIAKMPDNDISGFYDFDRRIIFVNIEENEKRQNFTIAHELGHYILHSDWVKSKKYQVLLRSAGVDENQYIEVEANTFAGHLLAPKYMLDLYPNLSENDLSDIFDVSIDVIKNRLKYINNIK